MTSPHGSFENTAYFTTRDGQGGQYGTLVSRAELGDTQAFIASRHDSEGFSTLPNTSGSMVVRRTQDYGYDLLFATLPEATKDDPRAVDRTLAMLAFAAFEDEVKYAPHPDNIRIAIPTPDADTVIDDYRRVLGVRRISRVNSEVDIPHDTFRTTIRRAVGRSALVLRGTQSYVSPFPAGIAELRRDVAM